MDEKNKKDKKDKKEKGRKPYLYCGIALVLAAALFSHILEPFYDKAD